MLRGAAIALTMGLPVLANAQNPLVNGKSITQPPLGSLTQPLGTSPAYGLGKGSLITPNIGSHAANLVASPDGKYAVATDLGFREYLSCVDTATGALVSQVGYSAAGVSGSFGLFYGLAFNPVRNRDGTWTLYAAQGAYQTDVGDGPSRTYSEVIDVLALNPMNGALTRVSTLRIHPVSRPTRPMRPMIPPTVSSKAPIPTTIPTLSRGSRSVPMAGTCMPSIIRQAPPTPPAA